MNPDQVIEELRERGMAIARRTLLRWETDGLIPEAKRGSYGQGGGKWTHYPDETIIEALTVSILKEVYRLRHDEISRARKNFNERKLEPYSLLWSTTLARVEADGYGYVRANTTPFAVNYPRWLDGAWQKDGSLGT